MSFCQREGVRIEWPIGSVAFSAFLNQASRQSKGSKGGASVAHSLKLAAVHARDHFCLPVELDAAVLFNVVKPHKGDADSATSPSLACLATWERLAATHDDPAVRHACAVATLACWLSLRAIHFVGLSALLSSNADDVRLNAARDKDGSGNIWLGCDASGLLGAFTWWPSFFQRALSRGFVACRVSFDHLSGDQSTAELLEEPATFNSMVSLFSLAFVVAGVPTKLHSSMRLTGHSPRHLLPCIAEVLMWSQALRDELGRWASGAANAKKVKCGPRYTVAANQSLQVFLRRAVRSVMREIYPLVPVCDGHEAVIPDFHAISALPAVLSSPLFGPHGPEYIPGFGRVGL